jgi:hypothetical protein
MTRSNAATAARSILCVLLSAALSGCGGSGSARTDGAVLTGGSAIGSGGVVSSGGVVGGTGGTKSTGGTTATGGTSGFGGITSAGGGNTTTGGTSGTGGTSATGAVRDAGVEDEGRAVHDAAATAGGADGRTGSISLIQISAGQSTRADCGRTAA